MSNTAKNHHTEHTHPTPASVTVIGILHMDGKIAFYSRAHDPILRLPGGTSKRSATGMHHDLARFFMHKTGIHVAKHRFFKQFHVEGKTKPIMVFTAQLAVMDHFPWKQKEQYMPVFLTLTDSLEHPNVSPYVKIILREYIKPTTAVTAIQHNITSSDLKEIHADD